MRLENIRDGIGDYEYPYLLRERAPEHRLLNVGSGLSRDCTRDCKDGRVLEERRAQVAAAIGAASSR